MGELWFALTWDIAQIPGKPMLPVLIYENHDWVDMVELGFQMIVFVTNIVVVVQPHRTIWHLSINLHGFENTNYLFVAGSHKKT